MRRRAEAAAATGRRILEATEELFLAGPLSSLTLASVADRAGVTVQTVIRRYGDRDGLLAATAEGVTARVAEQRGAAPRGDLRGAVANLVEHYETTGTLALRLLAEEEGSETIGRITRAGRNLHRQWCARVFGPHLDGLSGTDHDRRLAQFVAVCDVCTWKLLRLDAGLSRDQVHLALLEMLEPLTRRP
jgi:AcrR family transcriptional regulator